MTQQGRAVSGRRHAGPENTPRLRLKPKAPPTGYVDGAWWPKAPPRLLTGERAVQLEGHGLQTISTLEVLGVNRKTAMLLVVPPQTDSDHAHETMMTAAAPDNASTVDDLLMVIAQDRKAQDRKVGRPWTAVTEERWTADDGTIR
jgi:Family of unknown function (DUF5994)